VISRDTEYSGGGGEGPEATTGSMQLSEKRRAINEIKDNGHVVKK